MLKLSPGHPDELLVVDVHQTHMDVPAIWGFILYQGTPENASVFRGVTLHFAGGGPSNHVVVNGPVTVGPTYVPVDEDGTHNPGRTTISFGKLPQEPVYLLAFTAGTPFDATATVSSARDSIELLGVSSGETTAYVGYRDFETRGQHAAAHSPGHCRPPPSLPVDTSCDVCCYQPSGTWASLDIGTGRSASFEFQHHPYYVFGVDGKAGVARASVTDPAGNVRYTADNDAASVDGMSGGYGGAQLSARGAGPDLPPGLYTYDIDLNANANVASGAYWDLVVVDFQFPEEQQATP